MSGINYKPVGIFWDIENCSVPKNKSASAVIAHIRNFFVFNRLNHREYEFLVACDVTRIRKDVPEDINRAGSVTLAHVSGSSKNAADEKLRENMKKFVDTHSNANCPTLVLISGDIDFVNDLRGYQMRMGCTIVLIHTVNCSPQIKIGWNEIYSFQDFCAAVPLNPALVGSNHQKSGGDDKQLNQGQSGQKKQKQQTGPGQKQQGSQGPGPRQQQEPPGSGSKQQQGTPGPGPKQQQGTPGPGPKQQQGPPGPGPKQQQGTPGPGPKKQGPPTPGLDSEQQQQGQSGKKQKGIPGARQQQQDPINGLNDQRQGGNPFVPNQNQLGGCGIPYVPNNLNQPELVGQLNGPTQRGGPIKQNQETKANGPENQNGAPDQVPNLNDNNQEQGVNPKKKRNKKGKGSAEQVQPHQGSPPILQVIGAMDQMNIKNQETKANGPENQNGAPDQVPNLNDNNQEQGVNPKKKRNKKGKGSAEQVQPHQGSPPILQVIGVMDQMNIKNPEVITKKPDLPKFILVVCGLPGKMDFLILKNHLQEQANQVSGEVKYVKNGQAFIKFNNKANADRAVQLFNGKEIYGKKLSVTFTQKIPYADQNDKKLKGATPPTNFVMVNHGDVPTSAGSKKSKKEKNQGESLNKEQFQGNSEGQNIAAVPQRQQQQSYPSNWQETMMSDPSFVGQLGTFAGAVIRECALNNSGPTTKGRRGQEQGSPDEGKEQCSIQ